MDDDPEDRNTLGRDPRSVVGVSVGTGGVEGFARESAASTIPLERGELSDRRT